MEQIRYRERIWADQTRIDAFLDRARVGIIGMDAGEYPYAVPVNYVMIDGAVYFHGMGSGKKVDLCDRGPQVCFTVYEEIATVNDSMPCHIDTSYFSVMITGRVARVEDPGEAARALQRLLDKFAPTRFPDAMNAALVKGYRSDMDGRAVAVYRIETASMTAKQNLVDPSCLIKEEFPDEKAEGE